MAEIITLGQSEPLGLYISPGRNAARLGNVLARDERLCTGVVLDAAAWPRYTGLLSFAKSAELQTVLDTRSLELASETGGRDRSGLSALSWYLDAPHTRSALAHHSTRTSITSAIAYFAVQSGVSSVLAPTPYIESTGDAWWDLDDQIVSQLRRELDSRGGSNVGIFRPVYLHSAVAQDPNEMGRIATRLTNSHADALWVAIHPFGTSHSGPLNLRRYVDACRILHSTGLPIVGLHTGTVGLLLMAVGAVGGIESGLTDGENFNIEQRTRPPAKPKNGKAIGTRVYFDQMLTFLTTSEANKVLESRGAAAAEQLCQSCCSKSSDMLGKRIDHFVLSRSREVKYLSSVPPHRRTQRYQESVLRPTSEKLRRAARALPRLTKQRDRVDTWSQMCSDLLQRDGGMIRSFAKAPALRMRPSSAAG